MATLFKYAAVILFALLIATSGAGSAKPEGRGFVLGGEAVAFDAALKPRFSSRQVRASASATRAGFLRWADTAEGKAIIRRLRARDREVIVVESASESGVGRAPQPGFMTLLAASDTTTLKRYELILNPALAAEYDGGSTLDLGLPRTPTDAMAVAWAAEMLHIDFYARGIPLPHHRREDFQERWNLVASQLGLEQVRHGTEDVQPRASW